MHEDDLSDLEDATVKDTVRCHCCEASFADREGIIVEVPQAPLIDGRSCVATLALCMECAAAAVKKYRETLAEMDVCEHEQAAQNKAELDHCKAVLRQCLGALRQEEAIGWRVRDAVEAAEKILFHGEGF